MSSTILSDLKAVALRLGDDKVTIRKNHDDSLRNMLANDRIISTLNESTIRGGNNFSWTDLYRSVFRYLDLEVKRTEKEMIKIGTSAPKKKNQLLEKVKQGPISLLQLVLKRGNQSQPFFRSEKVVDNMIEILNLDSACSPFFRSYFGDFAVHVVMDKVLSVRKYRSELRVPEDLSGNQWMTLLIISFDLFVNIPENLDFHSCCKFLQTVVVFSCQYTDVRNLLRSKTEILEQILRSSKLAQASVDTRTVFLEALNKIILEIASDYRGLMCQFGEAVTPTMLNLCADERNISNQIIRFFITQVTIHHPDGSVDITQGALYGNEKLWKEMMNQIYFKVVVGVAKSQIKASRTKFVRSTKLRNDIVELGALVGRHVLYSKSNVNTVALQYETHSSQSSSSGDSLEISGIQPAKRRKIHLEPQASILKELSVSDYFEKNEDTLLPWLQVLERIFFKYPHVIVESWNLHFTMVIFERIVSLLQIVQSQEVKEALLSCAHLIIKVSESVEENKSQILQAIRKDFLKLWETALSIVSLNQCTREGHKLLRVIISYANQEQVSKLYRLFLDDIVKCSRDSVETLLSLLVLSPAVPEVSLRNLSSIQDFEPDQLPADSGRRNLLEWLWTTKSDSINNKPSEGWLSVRKSSSELLASVLAILTVRIETDESRKLLAGRIFDKLQLKSEIMDKDLDFFLAQTFELERLHKASTLFGSNSSFSEVQPPSILDEGLSIINSVRGAIHDKLMQLSSRAVTTLNDKNQSCEDEVFALDTIRFYLHFLKTFQDWGIPLSDKKSTKEMKRMIEVHKSTVEKLSENFKRLLANEIEGNHSSYFLTISSEWILLLQEVRECAKHVIDVIDIISSESVHELYNFVHDSVLTKFVGRIFDLFNKPITVLHSQTQPINNQSDDVDFFDEEEDSKVDFEMGNQGDAFNDLDEGRSEFKHLEKVVHQSFLFLTELIASSEILRKNNKGVVFNRLNKYIQELARIKKMNGLVEHYLIRFIKDTVTACVEQTFCPFGSLDLEDILESFKLLQTLAISYLTQQVFQPRICKIMIRAMALILNHIKGNNNDTKKINEKYHEDLDVARYNFVKLFSGLIKTQNMASFQRFSTAIETELVDLVGKVSLADPLGQWTKVDGETFNTSSHVDNELSQDPKSKVPISRMLARFVVHPNHKIRFRAASHLVQYFLLNSMESDHQEICDLKRELLFQVYKSIAALCSENLPLSSLNFSKDEKRNRTATFLFVLSSVAMNYPPLEYDCVARILAPLHLFKIPDEALKQVFTSLSHAKNSQGSVNEYLEPMLPYILKEFFKQNKLWVDFPFKLLDCESISSFAKDHEKLLLPVLLWNGKSDVDASHNDFVTHQLVEFSRFSGKDLKSHLVDNFSEIVLYFLPTFILSDKNPALAKKLCHKKEIDRAAQIHQILDKELTTEKYFRLLSERMPEILGKILSHIQDPEHLMKYLEAQKFDSFIIEKLLPLKQSVNPPTIPVELVTSLLDYFGRIVAEGSPLFDHLVSISSDCLVRLFLILCASLKTESARPSSKLRSLHGLSLLVNQLTTEITTFQSEKLISQIPYLSWYLTHTLMNFITSTMENNLGQLSTSWQESALGVLMSIGTWSEILKLCRFMKEMHVKRNIIIATNTLIKVITDIEKISEKTSDGIGLQTFVLIRNVAADTLTSILSISSSQVDLQKCLDPFPESSFTFKKVLEKVGLDLEPDESNESLSSVIETFIGKETIQFCGTNRSLQRKEGLQRVLSKIRSCRPSLKGMLKDLSLCQGMSEDASKSLLHLLVSQLINLSNSENLEVKELATQCLGEIGPLNLNTLVLNPAKPLESIPVLITKLILNYIVANDQATSSGAVIALKHVLCTKEGKDTFEKELREPEFSELVAPFNGPLCSATIDFEAVGSDFKPFDAKTFTQKINDESLWSPEVVTDPNSYICKLVTNLLSEFPTFKKSQFKLSPVLGRHLKLLSTIQPEFSKKILPLLVHHIFTETFHEMPQIGCVLSKQINKFFEKHFQSYSPKRNQSSSFLDLNIVRTMLSICGYLRMFNKPQAIGQTDQRRSPKSSTTWENNFWINEINYLHLAKAAFSCSDFFTAVQYADIWCLRVLERSPELSSKFAVSFQQTNLLNFLHENHNDPRLVNDVKICQKLLAETYQHLGNIDAIYGCGEERLLNVNSRILHLVNENQLYKALGMYDQLASQSEDVDYEEGLLSTLLSSGFYHTMNGYIRGIKRRTTSPVQSSILEFQNECAWRLGQWSSIEGDGSNDLNSRLSFSRLKIFALDNLLGEFENPLEFVKHISSARNLVTAELHRLSFSESACTSISSPLTKLRSLRELEIISDLMPKLGKRIADIDTGIHDRVASSLSDLQSYGEILLTNYSSDFEDTEVILSQRCVALSFMADKQRLDNINESPVKRKQLDLLNIRRQTTSAYISNALELNQIARENGRFQIALNCLSGVKNLIGNIQKGGKHANLLNDSTCTQLEMKIQYEESLLMWDWKERDLASKQLKQVVKVLQSQESNDCNELLPEALGKLGYWMSELRSEHASTIVDQYLSKAVKIFEILNSQNISNKKIVEAYVNFAKFSDDQYTRLSEYMTSKDFEDTQHLTAQIREESKSIKDVGASARDAKYATIILDRNSDLDSNEIQRITDEKLRYLLCALENYCKALSFGDSHDLKAYRLVSLWFSNLSEEIVCQSLKNWLQPIQSYKFVGLLYQLCARMVTQCTPGIHATSFPKLLTRTIVRCALKHPYHALPIILALSNSDTDEQEVDEGTVKQPSRGATLKTSNSRSGTSKVQEERTRAAKQILYELRKRREDFVSANENLALGLIKLAYQKDEKVTSGRVAIDRAHPLRKLKNLVEVPVPTINIPVSFDESYPSDKIVTVVEIAPEYQMVGGINAPKKIKCLGSDGKWRPQLVKGRDDLRQDAVMQQVFGLMNTLLTKEKSTQKRRLNVRQYKVVPLSQRSGILEWCENTVVMKDFLIGEDSNSGAHKRYHPEDFLALKCRKELADIHKSKKRAEILKVFLDICKNIKPAMKYFFFENFPSPGVYLERRLAYSRSSATSSMVGYILGLGDRHVQNILIDSRTAEMIHIDLGIAFDQGKILPSPETIPFRLTRDVIDGLGPSGVEGTFQRCCEATMRVLRSHKDEIMTILEVLVHDPLYNWSLTPSKAYKLQTGLEPDDALKAKWEEEARKKRDQEGKNDKSGNSMAERVLLKVLQKLNGTADGSYLSVEGQVSSLIQQARDPERLCALYVGWQPYL